MARGATGGFASGRKLVRVGQRKPGSGVIENTVSPHRDGVTARASRSGRREICRDVIGNISAKSLRAVPGRLVTAQTIRGAQSVVVIDMTCGACCRCWRHVRARQSETGRSVVKRGDIRPRDGVVTGRAIGDGKLRTSGRMSGIVGLLPGRKMAPGVAAIGWLNR